MSELSERLKWSVAIRWADDRLFLLDQRRLPAETVELELRTPEAAADAIRDLVVRGAPAIGITAAYAVVLAALQGRDEGAMSAAMARLRAARPTAVNLAWALDRMARVGLQSGPAALLSEAEAIHHEDIEANLRMGAFGSGLIEQGTSVLTHCNTGSLATGGYGTALGVIRSAHAAGKIAQVYAGETRPWLQGARLTAWELQRDGIDVALVIEGAVASLFRQQRAHWLIAGSDRIVANGDVANKIGTYSAALHARSHGARVMIVAPCSTVDLGTPSGEQVPIEARDPEEILSIGGKRVAAEGAGAWNPVFDITPASLVDCIVTEKGVAVPPFTDSLPAIA